MDIENLNIDIDLLKFSNAGILSIQGRGEVKKCVVIPVEDNDIYVSADEQTGRAKSAYLHLTAWKSREEKFGQTHYVTQNLSQEYKEAHQGEERKPILGNGKAFGNQDNNAASTVSAPFAQYDETPNDLPF